MHWIWSFVAGLTGQRLKVREGGSGANLHLTFDDGPHVENTPRLLDVLAEYQATATFFLLGNHAKAHPELVERIVREGHRIANHSMTHPNFRTLSPAQQLKEIALADAVLTPFDGRAHHAFRPPRGNATVTTIATAILRREQPLVLWNVDSYDFKLPEAELRQRLAQYQPRGGDILLFHDDMPATVVALREFLPRWRQAGFTLSAV
ncbi:MAG: polysaccharide deacetylase family protein [Aquabacterium sp.]